MADAADAKKDTMSSSVFPFYGLYIGRIKSPPARFLDIGHYMLFAGRIEFMVFVQEHYI